MAWDVYARVASDRSKLSIELLYASIFGFTNPNSPKDVLEIPTTLGFSWVES